MEKKKILSIFGTRPEAIKMAPLVKALERDSRFESMVCTTGQHREILDQSLAIFDVAADRALDVMRPGQTLAQLTSRVLCAVAEVLSELEPDLVLVHGDTTTSFAAALAAFYAHVPVGHVEAGLRTETIALPFPEELNRRLTGRMAALHFAPTQRAAENLRREGTVEGVHITGNTAIDALRYTVRDGYAFHAEPLKALDLSQGRWVLLTAHRRENWGQPLENICEAVLALCARHPDVRFICPVHPNPLVGDAVRRLLGSQPQVSLMPPVDVMDMHNLMARCCLVLTDSGGLQEEAPALGAPVVVLRGETERPEAVEGGTAVLAGTERDNVLRLADRLLSDAQAHAAMARAISPFGDGYASEKIIEHLAAHFSL